ncbi:hypothetical protein GCM10025777_25330 [Membranihabitans marinus]
MAITSLKCYSQITYEKGYFISDNNQKVNCLIKNVDWKNNPTEFEYKLNENSDKQKATIETVKEFGIHNKSKYSRHKVKIDKSSKDISRLSVVKKFDLIEEELFLKVLIEGKASLYSFEQSNLLKFFYNKDDSSVEQLFFKKYLDDRKIHKNDKYKQQLWIDLKCQTIKMSKVENLDYDKNQLIKFFKTYNECNNYKFTVYEEKKNNELFKINVRPGINYSSLSMKNSISNLTGTEFDNKVNFRMGIEFEYVLPFLQNKWSILLEPTYQYYKTEKVVSEKISTIDYKSIEIPFGVRYSFFLNPKSKIFINASYVIDLSSSSSTIIYNSRSNLDIKSRINYAIGAGYNQNNKYSLELRYYTGREVLSDYVHWKTNYSTLSIIFGYSIL